MSKKFTKISLDINELTHIRDLFSVMFEDGISISERLANLLKRNKVEVSLWQKIYKECENLNLPLDKEAPNFLVSPKEINLDIFNAKILYEDDSQNLEEKEKINEKSNSNGRSKNLSSSQNEDKNNSLSSSRRSNKKKFKG